MGKVSRKDLERLIEGVISERFKPIDISKRISPAFANEEGEDGDVINTFGLDKDTKVVKDPSSPARDPDAVNKAKSTLGFTKGTGLTKNQINHIAALKDDDGAPQGNKRQGTFLSYEDYKILFDQTDETSWNIVKKMLNQIGKFSADPGKGVEQEVLIDFVKLYIDSNIQKTKDPNLAKAREELGSKADLILPAGTAGIRQTMDEPKGAEFGLGRFTSPYRGASISPGDKTETTLDRFNKVDQETVQLDPLLQNMFNVFEGSINERFKSIEEFSKIVVEDDPSQLENNIKNWMKDNNKNQFDVMNYVYALSMLVDEAKKSASPNAGAFLEGFLNYFVGAPSLGEMQAATDNITRLLGSGDAVYLSAKFYVKTNKVQQKEASLKAETADGKSIFYIIALKDTEASAEKPKGASYSKVSIAITEIFQVDGRLRQVPLDKNLEKTSTGKKNDAESDVNKGEIIIGNPVYSIMALPDAVTATIDQNKRTFDQIFVAAVEGFTGNALPVVEAITKNLNAIQELDYKTKKISGDVEQSGKEVILNNKGDLVKRFTELQDLLKNGYDTIFGATKATPTTTESKITADYLKKLIEESFNK